MTESEIYDIMQPIIRRVTQVPVVIPADDNRPAPTGPYAAMRVKSGIQGRGKPIQRSKNGSNRDLDIEVSNLLFAEIAIDFYRGEAMSFASKVINVNMIPSISMELQRAKIGWMGQGPINNLTALQSNQMEQRANIEITLSYEETIQDNVNAIENVPFQVYDEENRKLAEGDVKSTQTQPEI